MNVKVKHGHGRYAGLDIEEYRQYEILPARQKLLSELEKGCRSGEEEGCLCADEVETALKIHG